MAMEVERKREALNLGARQWGGVIEGETLKPIGPALAAYLDLLDRNAALPPTMRDGVPWLVAQTDPRVEATVAKGCLEQRLFGYCPEKLVEVKTGHGRWVNGFQVWKMRSERRALMPCYVLVQHDATDSCQSRIKGTKGVQRVVSFGARVACVPHSQVLKIKAMEVDGIVVIPEETATQDGPTFEVGDFVRVVDGPFIGFFGTVLELVGKSRISIELQMLGSLTPVEMALHQVELVTRKVESPPRR